MIGNIKDMLEFLKCKPYIEQEDYNQMRLTDATMKEFCNEFGFNVSVLKYDKEIYRFFNKDGVMVKNFHDLEIHDNEYWKLVAQFRNQEDLDRAYKRICADARKRGLIEDDIGICTERIEDLRLTNYTCEAYFPDFKFKSKIKHPKERNAKSWGYWDTWRDMPEYIFDFCSYSYAKFAMYFKKSDYSLEDLSKIFEQSFGDSPQDLWYPVQKWTEHTKHRVRWLGGEQPQYPIFVVSRGRSGEYKNHISHQLTKMQVDHYIVVEDWDYDNYVNSRLNQSKYCTVLKMDMSYKDKYDVINPNLGGKIDPKNGKQVTGPGAARNWAADYAKYTLKQNWCWILDDNTDQFTRYWRGRRVISHSPEIFRSCERFVDRYTNIGIAGLNYECFAIGGEHIPPLVLNTRIYSYGLWNLNCPYIMQRGRYNEDTIQSLDILTHGWCTVQFNCMLADKMHTQAMKGGNTEVFYSKDLGGTIPKSQLLVETYPQYATLVYKFERIHHVVDYSSFTQQLKLKPEYEYLTELDENVPNEHGAYCIRIPEENFDWLRTDEKDCREYLEKTYPKGCPEDITNSKLFIDFPDMEDYDKCPYNSPKHASLAEQFAENDELGEYYD